MEISALDKSIASLEKAISKLESSSDSLDVFLWICTGAVVIGVALELVVVIKQYRDDHKAWRRATIRTPEKPSIRLFVFELVATVLVTAGVFGELLIGVVSGNINTELRNKNRSLVGFVRQKASNAEEEAEAIRRQNLLLQADLLNLEKQAAARRLSGLQADALVRLLRSTPTPLAVSWNPFDVEARDFGQDIISALRAANWIPVMRTWLGVRYGVAIGVAAPLGTFEHLPAIRLLKSSFRAALGITPNVISLTAGDASMNPPVQEGVIYLFVGQHPALKFPESPK